MKRDGVGDHPFFVRHGVGNRRRHGVTSFLYAHALLTIMEKKRYRPESDGSAKTEYQKNKKRILAEQEVCAICGRLVDKRLKFPHPMSASVDHIIPIAKGGHPSAIENLQLTHLICNQVKSSKLVQERNKSINTEQTTIGNRDLPQSRDWTAYRG